MSVRVSIDDLVRMCDGLSVEERGVFVSLAGMCYLSKNPGRALFPLGEFGSDTKRAWEVVTGLAMRGKIQARVVVMGCDVAIDDELRWQEVVPAMNTILKVEIETVREDALRREKRRAVVRGCVARFREKDGEEKDESSNVIRENSITTGDVIRENGITTGDVIQKNGITEAAPLAGARTSVQSVINNNNTPGGNEKKQKRGKLPKIARIEENTPMMARIGQWFGRRPTTRWTVDEAERLKAVAPAEDELDLMEAYYASGHPEIAPFRRRSIETLLNNWTKDCDMARQKLAQFGGLPEGSGPSSSSGTMVYGNSSVGDFTIV